jgi:hypothetical protein
VPHIIVIPSVEGEIPIYVKNPPVFHTLSEVKGTDTLSQKKQRVFTPFPD